MSCGVVHRRGSNPSCCGCGVGRQLCSSHLPPSLGTSICHRCYPKKQNKRLEQRCLLGYGSKSQNPWKSLNILQQKNDNKLWNIHEISLNTKKNEINKCKDKEMMSISLDMEICLNCSNSLLPFVLRLIYTNFSFRNLENSEKVAIIFDLESRTNERPE